MIGQGFRVEATEVITSEVHKRIRDLDVDPRTDIRLFVIESVDR